MRLGEKQWLWTKIKTDIQKTFSIPMHKKTVIDVPRMAELGFIYNMCLRVRQTPGNPHVSKPKLFFLGT